MSTSKQPMFLSFLSGILFIFGLSKNPAESICNDYNATTDGENIASDWKNIGMDIHKSDEQFQTTSKTN